MTNSRLFTRLSIIDYWKKSFEKSERRE